MASMFKRARPGVVDKVEARGAASPQALRAWMAGTAPGPSDPANPIPELHRTLSELSLAAQGAVDHAVLEAMSALIEDDTLGVPHFPDTPLALDEELGKPEPSQRAILRIVERDPELVRLIWKRATQANFRTGPVSIGQAITRLGVDELWRLGVSHALMTVVFQVPGYTTTLDRARRQGLACAEVASWLAREPRGPHYIAGLLHDVGALLVLRSVKTAQRRERPTTSLVVELIRRTHAPLGLLAARAWGFGEEVGQAIAYHHDPRGAPSEHADMATRIQLADLAVRSVDPDEPTLDIHRATRHTGLGKSDVDQIVRMARVVVERLSEAGRG